MSNVAVLHHSGVVVSNLEASIEFYREMFGFEPEARLDHIRDVSGGHGVAEAEYSLAILAVPGGRLELLAYSVPDDAPQTPRGICDVGASHFAFAVDDADATMAELAAKGMRLLGDPLRIKDGPTAGLVIAYGLDLDGNRLEFLQLPASADVS